MSRLTIRMLIAAQNGKCAYCGVPMVRSTRTNHSNPARATVDHRVPKCRGGSGAISNKVAACGRCNSMKGHLTDTEFMGAMHDHGLLRKLKAIAAADPLFAMVDEVRLDWDAWAVSGDAFGRPKKFVEG